MKKYLLIFTVILLCSCSNNSSRSTLYSTSVNLPNFDKLQDLYLSEIAESVDYLALSNEVLVSRYINRNWIKFADNGIVVTPDKTSAKLFDYEGNFKNEVGMVGRGPGEYRVQAPINGVTVKDKFYILEDSKIKVYDLSHGTYSIIDNIGDRKITLEYSFLFRVTNDLLLAVKDYEFHNDNPPPARMYLYNPEKGVILDSIADYNDLKTRNSMAINISNAEMVSHYRDESYYLNMFSDTVYMIKNSKIEPFAVYDRGKYKVPVEIVTFQYQRVPEIGKMLDELFVALGMIKNGNHIYTKYRYGTQQFIHALNLDNMSVRYCKPYFINDLDNGPNYTMGNIQDNPIAIQEVALYKQDPENHFVEEILFPNNKIEKKMKDPDKFIRLVDAATEDSNPIIQIVKFKH